MAELEAEVDELAEGMGYCFFCNILFEQSKREYKYNCFCLKITKMPQKFIFISFNHFSSPRLVVVVKEFALDFPYLCQ
ncbi:MAG: hypothetical protein HC821_01855 [Lewinella sp.]|nr:hypothetical protein [Lewinella sp.]